MKTALNHYISPEMEILELSSQSFIATSDGSGNTDVTVVNPFDGTSEIPW